MKELILPSKPGVYCFLNLCNGKRYVGQSINIRRRYNSHKYELKNGKHHNQHLQRAWNKYGNKNFKYIILEICRDEEHAIEREQYWADKFKSFVGEKGYNIGKCMKVWNTGIKLSESTRKKMSVQRKKNLTPKMLKMLQTMNIGRKFGKEFREKCAKNFLGKHHSKESKKKLSIAQSKHQASLTKSEKRKAFSHKMKVLRLISPDGQPYEITGIRGFCEEFKLDRAAIGRVIKKTNKHHLGWRAFDGDIKQTKFIIKKY